MLARKTMQLHRLRGKLHWKYKYLKLNTNSEVHMWWIWCHTCMLESFYVTIFDFLIKSINLLVSTDLSPRTVVIVSCLRLKYWYLMSCNVGHSVSRWTTVRGTRQSSQYRIGRFCMRWPWVAIIYPIRSRHKETSWKRVLLCDDPHSLIVGFSSGSLVCSDLAKILAILL